MYLRPWRRMKGSLGVVPSSLVLRVELLDMEPLVMSMVE